MKAGTLWGVDAVFEPAPELLIYSLWTSNTCAHRHLADERTFFFHRTSGRAARPRVAEQTQLFSWDPSCMRVQCQGSRGGSAHQVRRRPFIFMSKKGSVKRGLRFSRSDVGSTMIHNAGGQDFVLRTAAGICIVS